MTTISEKPRARVPALHSLCGTASTPLHPNCDGDADTEPISWESAQEEAGKWLGTLRLGRDLFGKTVDLSQLGHTLSAEGKFREMVLEAARRKLVKRKAKDIILPL